MDQPPNIEMVYLAVSTLYNNPNTTEKEKASSWLGDLQKSVSRKHGYISIYVYKLYFYYCNLIFTHFVT